MEPEQRIAALEALLAQRDALLAERDAQIVALLERIETLEATVTQLKELLAENKRASKRQATPFARNKRKKDKKKPGRKPGQGKWDYRKPPAPEEIDQTKHVPLPSTGCPDCGQELTDVRSYEQFIVDIPQVKPEVTKVVTEGGRCDCCNKRVYSRSEGCQVAPGGASATTIGPRARALAAELHHRMGMSWDKIQALFLDAFGMEVSRAGLCRSDLRLARELEPVYQELIEAISQSSVACVDETGWRIGVLSAWLWVFTNRELTVYTIDEGRGHEVVLSVLGQDFQGTLVGDRFSAYDHHKLADWLKQKCLSHLLKNLSDLEESKTKGAVRFARNVSGLLREAIGLQKKRSELPREEFEEARTGLEEQLDAVIAEKRQFSDEDNARMARQLRKQRKHLLRFLYDAEVPATNNQAERQLRPAVIRRKTGGCNKTKGGARAHAVLASIAATCKQQAVSVIEFLERCQKAMGALPKLVQPPEQPEPG